MHGGYTIRKLFLELAGQHGASDEISVYSSEIWRNPVIFNGKSHFEPGSWGSKTDLARFVDVVCPFSIIFSRQLIGNVPTITIACSDSKNE